MQRYTRIASLVFGLTMLALAMLVTAETLLRKIASISIGGVDELSGYAIAIGAPLAFTVALAERAHIRINLLYLRLGPRARGVLDALAVLSLGALALFLAYFTVRTVMDTQAYQSIAQTPWATPLIYPQALWALAMLVFTIPAVWLAARAAWLLARGQWTAITQQFGPESVEEELQAELDDLQRR
jgi:TRAP-type C4-dicarboxylate transport system permease small subunit